MTIITNPHPTPEDIASFGFLAYCPEERRRILEMKQSQYRQSSLDAARKEVERWKKQTELGGQGR